MALAFVNRYNTVSVGKPDDLQKEWQECRSVIGRLDNTLVDLRKYGFGLISGLLTANGILGGIADLLPKSSNAAQSFTVPSPVIAALVSITMVLVVVLFVVDRYYSVLQWGATNKARSLEWALSLGTTNEILFWVKSQRWPDYVAPIQYGVFILVSAFLGAAVMGKEALPSLPGNLAAVLMWSAGLLSLISIIGLYFITRGGWDKLSSKPSNAVQDVIPVDVQMARPQVVKAGSCQEQKVAVYPPFPPHSKVLVMVKPTNQEGLSIVGCQVIEPQRLGITFLNSGTDDITPVPETCQVFVYV